MINGEEERRESRREEESGRVGSRAKKKSSGVGPQKEPSDAPVFTELSDAEKDLMSHMEQGWRLETDSLGGNPVLRSLKDDEVVRPLSANRSTVEALEKRGLIVQGKGGDPLRIEWNLKKPKK